MLRRILPVFAILIVVVALLPHRWGAGAGSAPLPVASPPAAEARAAATAVPASVPPEAAELLRNGRPWRAARRMREYLAENPGAPPEAVLFAARAEAEWGGWDRTRALLTDRDWLSTAGGGEGWFWLARAIEEERGASHVARATKAYERFFATPAANADPARRAVAQLRRGLLLLRLGDLQQGIAALDAARDGAPELGRWVDALAAEALAERGDTARVRERVASLRDGVAARRGRQARIGAMQKADDPRGTRALARELLGAAGASERAALFLIIGKVSQRLGDAAAAREALVSALEASPGSGDALAAARLLGEMGELAPAERLAVARVYDRSGANETAARHYGTWLRSGAGAATQRAEVQLIRGRALFDAGEYSDAAAVLAGLADAAPEIAAPALHLQGRAEYRSGNRTRAQQTFLRVAERFPGTDAGSEALFLVADLSHDAGENARARKLYRQVASNFRGRDRAGLSLMRLGGMAFQQREFGAAAAAWEEYRTTYPTGERWLEATYWAGRAREAAGERSEARSLYRAIGAREPLSYYSLRADERMREPFWPVSMNAAPASSPSARARVDGWLDGVDLLRQAGLYAEAEQEVDRAVDRAASDPDLLYPLAEALIERGYTVEAIRIGLRLQRAATGRNLRLLRILYPFPYRDMIAAEAREKQLDPYLVAALIRQESMFKARIASPVGARGLMQVMPETGRPLAAAAGIREWDPELLYQPEINVHLGTRFLADQMRTYRGSLPSVFSAYNAGPHRVEQWKQFPEYADEELFTERIPYRETRDYVKILTRNLAVYRGLYAGGG